MATSRLCSIPACGKPLAHLEWCLSHYHRWRRHGDPLAGGTAVGEPERFFRESVLTYEGNECLVWPYSKARGYGTLRVGDNMKNVSRLVCEHFEGPAPTSNHEAAHSCGKGHEGCVSRRHLSWKTPAGNSADRLVHGTHTRGERNVRSGLTESDARKILALKGKKLQREIALQFGVTRSNVADIHCGKTWGWLE